MRQTLDCSGTSSYKPTSQGAYWKFALRPIRKLLKSILVLIPKSLRCYELRFKSSLLGLVFGIMRVETEK
ncbi:hypothetical protein H5410_052926 [Solanum commersonii]|uniref:Uncharacterized protein n=1 Tax=Solanum commersonii TaxID=4109 RepID=A0A9J5X2F5_SOLCO|nr:hypothetical protein H5410_052926 [Solanum commersonii]